MEELHALGPKTRCRGCKTYFSPRPPNRVYCPDCSKRFNNKAPDVTEIEKDTTMRWRAPGW